MPSGPFTRGCGWGTADRRLSGEALDLAPVPQPAGHGPGLYAGDDTHSGEQGDDRRPAVADKGERQTHNGQDVQTHAHIEGDLAEQHPGHAHADIGVERGTGVPAHPHAPKNDGGQQQ